MSSDPASHVNLLLILLILLALLCLLLAGDARVELHAVRGQLHERLLERGPRGGKLVQPDRVLEREVADPVGGQAADDESAVSAVVRAAARVRDGLGEKVCL